jgi:hypothetical protein
MSPSPTPAKRINKMYPTRRVEALLALFNFQVEQKALSFPQWVSGSIKRQGQNSVILPLTSASLPACYACNLVQAKLPLVE